LKKHLRNFLRRHKIHLLCWSLFIAYEILIVGLATSVFGSFWDSLVHYAINISLFYLHALVLLPYALQKDKPRYWLITLLVLGEIISYTAVIYSTGYVISLLFQVKLSRPLVFDYMLLLRSTWRAIYFMGFATGYYYLLSSLREKRRAEHTEKRQLLHIIETQKLQNELIKSQNAFLKAQINPHFLSNTLSFVYNSVRKTSDQAAEAIIALS
jgi:two-component system, LytTR family, sensor kinase